MPKYKKLKMFNHIMASLNIYSHRVFFKPCARYFFRHRNYGNLIWPTVRIYAFRHFFLICPSNKIKYRFSIETFPAVLYEIWAIWLDLVSEASHINLSPVILKYDMIPGQTKTLSKKLLR